MPEFCWECVSSEPYYVLRVWRQREMLEWYVRWNLARTGSREKHSHNSDLICVPCEKSRTPFQMNRGHLLYRTCLSTNMEMQSTCNRGWAFELIIIACPSRGLETEGNAGMVRLMESGTNWVQNKDSHNSNLIYARNFDTNAVQTTKLGGNL